MDAILGGFGFYRVTTVSIHAPVMDAMLDDYFAAQAEYVSIHAPVMDAIKTRLKYTEPLAFQSTRP